MQPTTNPDVPRSAVPLDGLAPDAYARGHAAFETRSDQRRLITGWVAERLGPRRGPVAVLSVGCGDGSLDAELAGLLCGGDPSRPVRYVGVEPFAGSAAAFARRMEALAAPCLEATVHVSTFDDAPVHDVGDDGLFDVVTFVHSMYYVPDVAASLKAAFALLRPGGELLVLSAPRGALNQLAGALAPPVDGHVQWFSDDVAAGFEDAGIAVAERSTLEARVDLTGADDDVLDFTVQARLSDEVRPMVVAYLAAASVSEGSLVLPHPVDAYVAVK